ncbi:MAG: Vitamin B12 transporter BtuB [Gammaproteobacteria bacterium]|nr:Vitamin B12 transporter BtuB [Gammaproteobacteria bacterium]
MSKSHLVMLCMIGTALSSTEIAAITTPEIVVTATRTPVDTGRIAASTTVITREDIEARQADSVPELLDSVAGVDVARSGGPGKTTTFFLRGTESDHVLVLVNGIRLGSVSAGITAFELIPVEHIDRIEIVRGPRASQWGSEAIGGVIQIFTLSGKGLEAGEPRYEAGVGAGSYNTYKGSASVAGSDGSSHYQASVGYFDTEGFDARESTPGPFDFDQPDDDGYDNLSFHLRGGHRFNERVNIDAFLLRAEGTAEFDGSFQDETDFVQQVLGVRADWRLTDNASLRFRAGESRDEQENFAPDGSFSSKFDSKREELSLQADVEPTPGQVVNVGVDYRDDKIDSTSNFTETSRDNTGVFAQYLGTFGRHNLTASVRHDDNEAFGNETTGGLGWSNFLPVGLKLYTSYGTAFKTPSFNELFFPGFGNPELGPETSESVEFGIEGHPAWGWWSLRAYRTDVEELITTVFDPGTGVAFPRNVDEARIDGIEAEIRMSVATLDVGASLNVMNPEDRNTGNQLPRRAETTLSLDVSRDFDRLRVGGRLIAQDDRFDDADNTIGVNGFVTVDLNADYELSPGLFVRGKIGNLFDEDYETVATFNSPDRHAFVSLLYRNRP